MSILWPLLLVSPWARKLSLSTGWWQNAGFSGEISKDSYPVAVEDEPDQSQSIQPAVAKAQRELVDRTFLERKCVLSKCHTGIVLEEVLPSETLLVRERTENPSEGWKNLWGAGLWRLSART